MPARERAGGLLPALEGTLCAISGLLSLARRDGLRGLRYARLLARSGLLEADFYARQCPGDPLARCAPAAHYLLRGAAAGLDPNPFFDTSFYREENPDADAKGKNPLVHYLRHGAREGRATGPAFDTARYLALHPETAAAGRNPLAHFLRHGFEEGLDGNAVSGPSVEPGRVRKILVVDRRMPTPDQDSASVRMMAILAIMRRLGPPVTFASDSPKRLGRFEKALRGLGVEVVCGNERILAHLAARGGEYALALLSRPETAQAYLPLVRARAPRALVVYDTVDLHFLRYQRAAELTGDPDAARQSERYRALERASAAAADVTLTVTGEERERLGLEVPGARIEVLPNIHRCQRTKRAFADRRGLMFIGGYEHLPNVDAVEWFVQQILPRVRRRLPDLVLSVVGSRAPRRLKRLESPCVRVLGYVPDVAPLFGSSRVFVSPLRYGAGMKGKIGQSMSHGLPVVTTSVGAEGMLLVDGENALLADDPAAFADAVVRLYSDEELWGRIASASLLHIEAHFSEAAAEGRLRQILSAAPLLEPLLTSLSDPECGGEALPPST